MRQLRRALRGLRRVWRRFRSECRLLSYRILYAGFRAGRGVSVGPGVDVNVMDGGSLALGDGCIIEANVQLSAEGDLRVGPGSFVGRGSVIASAQSVRIGADALIAAYVTIRDQDHGLDQGGPSYSKQPKVSAPVSIGDNVWLGTHVTVLRGVTIGDGCVVGANSVVTADLPPRSVCVGAPARVVRSLA